MAISSINFKKTKANSEAETTRQFEAKYLLKEEYRKENEFWNCGVDERELFKQEFAKSKRKGGRIPKVENSLWEGVLNLNENHTMADVKKVADHIAKKFNVHATRIAIHRDEGHFNIITGEVEYNYHAHLNFMSWKDGKQNWRKEFIGERELAELQTEASKILGMQRGQYNSTSVRAEHGEFRKNAEEIKAQRRAQQEIQKTLAKQKDLKEQNAKLRKELKEAHAKREQYAELEALNRELKQKIKNKELSVAELEKKIKELKDKVFSKKYFIDDAPATNAEIVEYLEKEVENRDITVARLEAEKEELENREPEIKEVEKKIYVDVEKKVPVEVEKIVYVDVPVVKEVEKIVEIENPETKAKLISARERTKELETTVSTQQTQIQELENTVSSQNEDIFGFQKKAEKAENELIQARETIETQKTSISTLKDDLSVLEQDMSDLEAQNKELREQEPQIKEVEKIVKVPEIREKEVIKEVENPLNTALQAENTKLKEQEQRIQKRAKDADIPAYTLPAIFKYLVEKVQELEKAIAKLQSKSSSPKQQKKETSIAGEVATSEELEVTENTTDDFQKMLEKLKKENARNSEQKLK